MYASLLKNSKYVSWKIDSYHGIWSSSACVYVRGFLARIYDFVRNVNNKSVRGWGEWVCYKLSSSSSKTILSNPCIIGSWKRIST
jgi:hypothetical protein